ncbi:hypothetical protein TNIN_265371 [Trichonephila inaurata madagascariensis]|uniref:Uncharacterized protein n=1 Tax=Trichonephila inaurata madagascariensis TaxID=2747483 RepID=A0A8X6WU11_9ARAC|nr:hypothetical protein TNIN_265371 [Trichonephila inaurata madagascariensis]
MNAVSVGKTFSMRTTGRTLTYTLSILIRITAFQRQCVGRNHPRSFDQAISSAKAPRRRNVSGILTRGASSSTANLITEFLPTLMSTLDCPDPTVHLESRKRTLPVNA